MNPHKVLTYPEKVPQDLAALVALAVHDARALPARYYQPFSTVWHNPRYKRYAEQDWKPKCQICLAGAVIAITLGWTRDMTWRESKDGETPNRWIDAIEAVDEVRQGHYRLALALIDGDFPDDAVGRALDELEREHGRAGIAHFTNWEEFDKLLHHLEQLVPKLQALGV